MGTRLRQTKLAFGKLESWKVGGLEGNGAEASSLHKRERGEGWKG